MIHQLCDIWTGLKLFLALKNLEIDNNVIKFEWFISEFWQGVLAAILDAILDYGVR